MKIFAFTALLVTTAASVAQAQLRGAGDERPKQRRADRHDPALYDFVASQNRHEEAHYMFEVECVDPKPTPPPQPQPTPPPQPTTPGRCDGMPRGVVWFKAWDPEDPQAPQKCIGYSGNAVGVVDCDRDNQQMMWDFQNEGFWCMGKEGTAQRFCLSPGNFPNIRMPGGEQWNKWTYGDGQSGPRKIASYMTPGKCVVRSGSTLKLGSCNSPSSDWIMELACPELDRRLHGDHTQSGRSQTNPFICTRFYSGKQALGNFQCMYISDNACNVDAYDRLENPQWDVLTTEDSITSVDVGIFSDNRAVFIDRAFLRVGGLYGRVVRAWGNDNSGTWCLSEPNAPHDPDFAPPQPQPNPPLEPEIFTSRCDGMPRGVVWFKARDDPLKCIGYSGNAVGVVDCDFDDIEMMWDFKNPGFWCMGNEGTAQRFCLGPNNFPNIKMPGGDQWNMWTYGDGQSGQYKIASYMSPNECVVRSGSTLTLGSCNSPSSDWIMEEACPEIERRLRSEPEEHCASFLNFDLRYGEPFYS